MLTPGLLYIGSDPPSLSGPQVPSIYFAKAVKHFTLVFDQISNIQSFGVIVAAKKMTPASKVKVKKETQRPVAKGSKAKQSKNTMKAIGPRF